MMQKRKINKYNEKNEGNTHTQKKTKSRISEEKKKNDRQKCIGMTIRLTQETEEDRKKLKQIKKREKTN